MISNRPLKRAIELQPLSHDHHHGLQLCWKIRTGFSRKIELERIKKYADWFFVTHLEPHFTLLHIQIPLCFLKLVNTALELLFLSHLNHAKTIVWD